MLGLGMLLASCSGGSKANGLDAKSLLTQVAPSEAEVLTIISGEAAQKAEAASITPQQAPPADTIQFDLVLVDMWAEHGGIRLPEGTVPAEGDLGFILYNFYYLDTAPNPNVELEGKITFNFVYQGNEFVAADPAFTIQFVTVTATIQGDVVNAVIDALTPGVRDGFLRRVAVTAAADDGSVTRTAITNTSGVYKIKIFGGGRTYTVKAFRNGFLEGVKSDVSIAATETVTVNFDLIPAPDSVNSNVQTITGTVTDLDGNPVVGATVYIVDRVTRKAVPGADSCLTNGLGNYMIVAVPYGDYSFVSNKGSKSGTTDAVIPLGSPVVNIQIQDHPPVCAGITSNPPSPVDPGTQVVFTCQSTDVDDIVLYYDFHSSSGSFLVPGEWTLNTASWIAPDTAGTYTIDVVVSDGGLEDTCSINIQVGVKDVSFDTYYQSFSTHGDLKGFDVGDVNRDGIPDLALGIQAAFSNTDFLISALPPPPSFNYSEFYYEYGNPDNHFKGADAAIADFDQDGFMDAVFGSGNVNGTVIWGDGTGNFTFGNSFYDYGGARHIEVGDMNNDGDPDIVSTATLSHYVELRFHHTEPPPSHGYFNYYGSDGGCDVFSSPDVILIDDVNHDTWNDVIVLPIPEYAVPGQVGLCINNTPGLGFTSMYYDTGAPCVFLDLKHGDFDGNGIEDIIAVGSCTFTPGVYQNDAIIFYRDATGAVINTQYIDLGIGSRSTHEVATADFNGDGMTDFAVTIQSGQMPGVYYHDTIRVVLNMGNGNFSTSRTFDAGYNSSSIDIADFNGDSKPDIAAQGDDCGQPFPWCHSVSILLNTTPD